MTDLDAITFCGSWDADDCAFTNEGQPEDWACGFHHLVAEVRQLRKKVAGTREQARRTMQTMPTASAYGVCRSLIATLDGDA